MNKAITDGVVLMPPAFEFGLDVWSSGDGTPGSDTYQNAANAAFVPADQDFGGCLEIQKSNSTTKLRYMGETPLLPGCYLRVTARIKAISGNLPNVRIAGWAGAAGGGHVGGLDEVGPSVSLQSYGNVVEVSAIIGAGNRGGVDMVWGSQPIYGHFGLDLTGQNGGIVRVDDIVIEDITSVFLRDMMNWVDVRDYGAVGDGVTDDMPAFEAADDAANGRKVLVPNGNFFLGDSVTFESHVEFQGNVTMPDDKLLLLTKDFHLSAYVDAFGDEVVAFKKAFQALLGNSDHESLDLCGRRIQLREPIDMHLAAFNRTDYAQRRVIRNGQFYVETSSNWDDEVATSHGTYDRTDPYTLSNVTNVANVPVGSHVVANGVGREVYVRSKNIATQEIELSQPLHDADGTQVYTFTRYKYVLDFSGFQKISKMQIEDIEFNMSARCSGILLAPAGLTFHVKDCVFNDPKDRAITSHGEGCQGMLIDRCQFLSAETQLRAQDRKSVAINTNGNDVKLRDCRITQFRHFAVLSGSSNIVTGNHWFQGDTESEGIRTAGLVLSRTNNRTSVNGNYIDNCFVEWTNEHDNDPDYASEFSFSALNISNNTFQCGNTAASFRFIVVKPYGSGHTIKGLNVVGNTFRSISGQPDRVETVDTTYASLDLSKMANVTFEGNAFSNIGYWTENPVNIEHSEGSVQTSWTVDTGNALPFDGRALTVESVVTLGRIRNGVGGGLYTMPYVDTEQGANNNQVHVVWSEAARGKILIRIRADK